MDDIFIIAEIGVNHDGDLMRAKSLVKQCADLGLNAVKFQHFYTDEIVSEQAELADYQKDNTDFDSQYEMVKKLELTDEEMKQLSEYCDSLSLEFMATPFCVRSLDYLVTECNLKRVKVGSGEVINLKLLRAIGSYGLPIILSTGMCRDLEIEIAINVLCLGYIDSLSTLEMTHADVLVHLDLFKKNISILHCTTEYPCPPDEACLNEISRYRSKFESHVIGYSDHTLGVESALIASGLGAMIFEKHVTDDVARPGPDHSASLAIEDISRYLDAINLGKSMTLGAPDSLTSSEIRNAAVARRSLHKADSGFKLQRPYSGLSAYFESSHD